jgi:non-homologous end joining protein Ku
MQQLMYATEVRPISELEIPPAEVKPAELNLARQLIEQGASDKFDPPLHRSGAYAHRGRRCKERWKATRSRSPSRRSKAAHR